MNKVIFTKDRLFMTIVGPSGCGKTQLIHRMLKGKSFYPRFDKIYFFYQEWQPIYQNMQMELNIQFVPCVDFDMIVNLTDCLLILMIHAKKFMRTSVFQKLQRRVDTKIYMLFTSNIICFIKVNIREQLT